MAIVEDPSTPAAVTSTAAQTPMTCAAFSPPAGTLLVVLAVAGYSGATATVPGITISDSVSGVWTTAITQGINGTRITIARRYLSTAPGSMTVSAAFTSTVGDQILAVKVLSGADPTQGGAVTGTGGTTAAAQTSTTMSINLAALPGSWVLGGVVNNSDATALTLNANTRLPGPTLVDSTNGGWGALIREVSDPTGATITYGGTFSAAKRIIGAAAEIKAAAVTQAKPIPHNPARRIRASLW